MNKNILEGIVDNGQIRLLGDIHLPEKTRLQITVLQDSPTPSVRIASPKLVRRELAGDFKKNENSECETGSSRR